MAFHPYQKELNKQFLSGAIRHPEVLAEARLEEKDFDPDANRIVFSALKSCVASGQPFSEFVLINRLESLGIKIGGSIEPGLYIQALMGMAVNAKAAISIAKQIKKVSIRRELYEAARRVQATIEEDASASEPLKAAELVVKATGIFNEKVNVLSAGDTNSEPRDLYGTVGSFLDRDNSVSDKAIASPFPIFNDLYGYFDVGSTYLFVGRMKSRKSTLWLDMGRKLAAQDKDDRLRVLVLDTELEAWENHSRSLAAVSGVSEFRIRQGWYRQRPDELAKVNKAAEELSQLENRVYHCHCGGMSLPELVSVCERWAAKHLNGDKKGLIVYDYVKLNSQSDWSNSSPLFITIGEKADRFKRLAKQLNVPVIMFAQANRENSETKAGDKVESTAVISGSDMLAQFASCIFLLQEMTPDERAAFRQLGPDGATHSLKDLACRQRGPCSLGEDGMVKISDPKSKKERYVKNFLMYRFESFNMVECGTLRQIIEQNASTGINVQPSNGACTRADLL